MRCPRILRGRHETAKLTKVTQTPASPPAYAHAQTPPHGQLRQLPLRRNPIARLPRLLAAVPLALALAPPAPASTPAAWAALNRTVNRACLSMVDGRNKKITGTTASFPDTVPIELRYVEATTGRGVRVTMVCAYDRARRRAAVTEATPATGMGRR